jgi:uncharacterized protein with ParB-like and HNH nuclease domain
MFESKKTTFEELFDKKSYSNVFVVPPYQRQYSWNSENVEEYFADIQEISLTGEEERHFLGPIILMLNQDAIGHSQYDVVDGQQRLITTILLLSVLRDNLLKIWHTSGNPQSKTSLDFISSIIFDENTNKTRILVSNKALQERLFHYLEKPEISVEGSFQRAQEKWDYTRTAHIKALDSAYSILYKRIKEECEKLNTEEQIKHIGSLLKIVLERVDLLVITVDNNYNAYKMFETLNNRGLELAQSDLLKNKIISKFMLDKSADENKASEIWDSSIVEKIASTNTKKVDSFLRHYLVSTQRKPVTSRNIYKIFDELLFETGHKEVLNSLIISASNYSMILGTTSSNSNKIQAELNAMRSIGVESQNVLILAILDVIQINSNQTIVLKCLDYISKFSIRWVLSNKNAQELEKVYQGISQKVRKSSVAEDIVEIIKSEIGRLLPRKEEVTAGIIGKSKAKKEFAKYLLLRLEASLSKRSIKELYLINLELEHIAPSSSNSAIWGQTISESDEEYERLSKQYGNLTLLESNLNRNCSNKIFSEKRYYYKKSKILLTKNISFLKPDWQKDIINLRTKWFAESIAMITGLSEEVPDNFTDWYLMAEESQKKELSEIKKHIDSIGGDLTWVQAAYLVLPADGSYLHTDEILSRIKTVKAKNLSGMKTPENTLRRDLIKESRKPNALIQKNSDTNSYRRFR